MGWYIRFVSTQSHVYSIWGFVFARGLPLPPCSSVGIERYILENFILVRSRGEPAFVVIVTDLLEI